jgi:hypothetical protein
MISTLVSVAALGLGVAPSAADAAAIIEAGSSTVAAGQSGSFDVVLTSTGGSFDVSGFSVELSVPANSGVTFTGASAITTTAGYLFSTLQTPPLTFSAFPTTDFVISDASVTPPDFFVTVAPGQTYGLGHVTYSVASGTHPGVIPDSLLNLGTTTELLDVSDHVITSSVSNGSITVVGTSVPEPSSLILWLITAVTLLAAGGIYNGGPFVSPLGGFARSEPDS